MSGAEQENKIIVTQANRLKAATMTKMIERCGVYTCARSLACFSAKFHLGSQRGERLLGGVQWVLIARVIGSTDNARLMLRYLTH